MFNRANGTGTYRAVNATQAADFEETTEPESHVIVTNATLHRLMMKMNTRMTWMAAGIFFTAGSVALLAAFFWWSRPR